MEFVSKHAKPMRRMPPSPRAAHRSAARDTDASGADAPPLAMSGTTRLPEQVVSDFKPRIKDSPKLASAWGGRRGCRLQVGSLRGAGFEPSGRCRCAVVAHLAVTRSEGRIHRAARSTLVSVRCSPAVAKVVHDGTMQTVHVAFGDELQARAGVGPPHGLPVIAVPDDEVSVGRREDQLTGRRASGGSVLSTTG